jgi:hypothetical protein
MLDPKDNDWDISDFSQHRQPDRGSSTSVALWCHGLLEDPLDESDYHAAEEADHYNDLAFLERKRRSEENQEFMGDDSEDFDEQ